MRDLLLILVLLIFQSHAVAGYYGGSRVDEYDPNTGFYYKAIEIERENRGFISKGSTTQVTNISIFNPINESHSMLFKDNKVRDIRSVLFEIGIEDGVVTNNSSSHSQLLKNNHLDIARAPKDQMLVAVQVLKNDKSFTELWISSKSGENLKLLETFPASYSWHVDIKNSKIRIASYRNGKFSQKSIEW